MKKQGDMDGKERPPWGVIPKEGGGGGNPTLQIKIKQFGGQLMIPIGWIFDFDL